MPSFFDETFQEAARPALLDTQGESLSFRSPTGIESTVSGIVNTESGQEDHNDGRQMSRVVTITVSLSDVTPQPDTLVTVNSEVYVVSGWRNRTASMVDLVVERKTAVEISKPQYQKR